MELGAQNGEAVPCSTEHIDSRVRQAAWAVAGEKYDLVAEGVPHEGDGLLREAGDHKLTVRSPALGRAKLEEISVGVEVDARMGRAFDSE